MRQQKQASGDRIIWLGGALIGGIIGFTLTLTFLSLFFSGFTAITYAPLLKFLNLPQYESWLFWASLIIITISICVLIGALIGLIIKKGKEKKINRKGQEEMVGFVLIMVVVAVIFLVFLGIFVRQRGNIERADSTEVAQFLDAIVDVTTDCTLNGGFSYLTVSNLVEKCVDGSFTKCGEVGACTALRNILSNLTKSGWNFDAGSATRGFNLVIYNYDVTTNSRTIIRTSDCPPGQTNNCQLYISKGICDQTRLLRGADKLLYTTQGTVIIALDLCA